jgi:hypothetical protein
VVPRQFTVLVVEVVLGLLVALVQLWLVVLEETE